MRELVVALACGALVGCFTSEDAPWTPDLGGETFGEPFSATYHDANVNFVGNSCGVYPEAVQSRVGPYLALFDGIGLEDPFSRGSFCDTCLLVTTPLGRSAYVRVVGISGDRQAQGDLYLSSAAFEVLHGAPGETPDSTRAMTWQFAECPDVGPIMLQWAPDAVAEQPRLWVRNSVLPVFVSVQRAFDEFEFSLDMNPDGSLSSFGGFGSGPFELRLLERRDGVTLRSQMFESWTPGELVETEMQF